jgi:hypothetical protein
VNKAVWVEGIVLLGLASAGIIEAIYLIYNKDPNTVVENVGPGHYVLILAIPLWIAGLFYLISNFRKKFGEIGQGFKKQIDLKVLGIFLITAIYIYLIGMIGYFLSTVLFLILAFKFSGIKNWRVNFAMTFMISICYYIVFIKFCALIFPKPMFLGF